MTTITEDVDAILLSGSSCYSSAVETATASAVVTTADAATIAVFGSSLSCSSAVADAATMDSAASANLYERKTRVFPGFSYYLACRFMEGGQTRPPTFPEPL